MQQKFPRFAQTLKVFKFLVEAESLKVYTLDAFLPMHNREVGDCSKNS